MQNPNPLFLKDNIKLDEIYQEKLSEKYMSVFQGISSSEGTSLKKLNNIEVLLFPVVWHQSLHQQTLFFITFQNLIQDYLEKHFRHKFPFFNEFTQPHEHPKSAKSDESFLSMFPWLAPVNALLHHKHHALPLSLLFWWKIGSYFQ